MHVDARHSVAQTVHPVTENQATHLKSFNASTWFTAAHLSPTNLVTYQVVSKINRKGTSPEQTLAIQ